MYLHARNQIESNFRSEHLGRQGIYYWWKARLWRYSLVGRILSHWCNDTAKSVRIGIKGIMIRRRFDKILRHLLEFLFFWHKSKENLTGTHASDVLVSSVQKRRGVGWRSGESGQRWGHRSWFSGRRLLVSVPESCTQPFHCYLNMLS